MKATPGELSRRSGVVECMETSPDSGVDQNRHVGQPAWSEEVIR
jgi:hypothetical protein